MAGIAPRILPMLCQPLTNGTRHRSSLVVDIGIDTRRRRRDWQAEDVVEQVFSSQHGRGALGIRRGRKQCSLREQSTTLLRIRKSYSTESAAVDARNAILPRHTLI